MPVGDAQRVLGARGARHGVRVVGCGPHRGKQLPAYGGRLRSIVGAVGEQPPVEGMASQVTGEGDTRAQNGQQALAETRVRAQTGQHGGGGIVLAGGKPHVLLLKCLYQLGEA